MIYDFQAQRAEWSRIPVDDVGYVSTDVLHAMNDDELIELVMGMERRRYSGWRNHENMWRDTLGLDTTNDQVVMDFGCGIGLEALQFARHGNVVYLVDINPRTTQLALRVLMLLGYNAYARVTTGVAPFLADWPDLDVFYCNGVLHHLPHDVELLDEVAEHLRPDGEVRLMLYSDHGWTAAVGMPVPEGRAIDDDRHDDFARWFDEVGNYADFYDEERIVQRFGHRYDLKWFDYITADDRYCTATLTLKGSA